MLGAQLLQDISQACRTSLNETALQMSKVSCAAPCTDGELRLREGEELAPTLSSQEEADRGANSAVCTPRATAFRSILPQGWPARAGRPHSCPRGFPAWLAPPVGSDDSPTSHPVIPTVLGSPPRALSEVGETEVREDQRRVWSEVQRKNGAHGGRHHSSTCQWWMELSKPALAFRGPSPGCPSRSTSTVQQRQTWTQTLCWKSWARERELRLGGGKMGSRNGFLEEGL